MNRTLVGLLVGLALGCGATWYFVRQPSARTEAKSEPTAAKAEEKPNPLHLPPAKRDAAGIALVKPSVVALAPEIQGYGRVLDATPLVTLVSEVETARAALDASEKELERAKALFAAGGNASAQAVETAQAAAARDRAAFNSAQARLGSGWGKTVADHADALATALQQGAALVRIDVLPGEGATASVKDARVSLPGSTESYAAEVIGPSPVADPQLQGPSFLAIVRGSPLPSGASLRATLSGAGEATNALAIPRSAVVYHQGSAWIFVLGEEDTFERKLVALGRSDGPDTIVVASGVEPDEQVVARGAEQLLSAELQAGGAPEEP